MSIRAILFDCDGVLFRSEQANVGFYNEVLRLAGERPLAPDGEREAHALASEQLFAKRFAGQPELAARLKEIASGLDYTPFFDLMFPRPELRPAISALRKAGFRTAMATNRGKTTATVVAHFGLEDLFDFWVGALDVAKPKPAPDMLLLSLERMALDAKEAVYVGDQAGDEAAALAAGMPFVGMPPIAAKVEHAISSLEELEQVVSELG